MNKTFVLIAAYLTFIMAPVFQAHTQVLQTSLTLQAAISAAEVRATFSGTGRYSGDSVLLTVARTATAVQASFELTIPVGSSLRSTSLSHQNMVIAGIRGRYLGPDTLIPTSKIFVSGVGPETYILAAFCADFEKHTPSKDTNFVLEDPDPTLSCILSEVGDLSLMAMQAAVWVYTNGVDSIRNNIVPTELASAEAAAAKCGGHRFSRPSAQVPVLLLHGLWGNASSWQSYANHLRSNGWTEGPVLEFDTNSVWPNPVPVALVPGAGCNLVGAASIVPPLDRLPRQSFVRVVFKNNDGQSFELQGSQVAAAIADVRRRTGAEGVILVAHSMGGLAARAYLQSPSYQNDVIAVATVATPHMGSLLPYLRFEAESSCCPRVIDWLTGKYLDAPAVIAMAPDSAEMVALNTAATPYGKLPQEVQWLNIVAEYRNDSPSIQTKITLFQRDLTRFFDPTAAGSLASGKVLAQWTDGIVPVWSQVLSGTPVGASASVETAIVTGFHTEVPDLPQTWVKLDRFLGTRNLSRPLLVTLSTLR